MVDQAPPLKKQRMSRTRKTAAASIARSKLGREANRAGYNLRRSQAADPHVAKVSNILFATHYSSQMMY
jgi:hypothetical protein